MTSQTHAAAVLSLLSGAGITVYDGTVPNSPSYPYAVLFFDTGARGPDDLTLASDEQIYMAQVTSVGATAMSVRVCADRVAGALLDVTPSVAGRTCWPIRLEVAQAAREDRDITLPGTQTHPLYAVDIYRVASRPS